MWLGKLTALDMTPLGWLGRKTSTQKKKKKNGANFWYIALRTRALPSLFKCWSYVELWPFTARSNLRLYWFVWGEKLKNHFWWQFTAAKFTIRNFYNPSSQKCKPNNFLKSSSILTLMSLNSAFKHVSLLHSDNYKERLNIQNNENFKLLKK